MYGIGGVPAYDLIYDLISMPVVFSFPFLLPKVEIVQIYLFVNLLLPVWSVNTLQSVNMLIPMIEIPLSSNSVASKNQILFEHGRLEIFQACIIKETSLF